LKAVRETAKKLSLIIIDAIFFYLIVLQVVEGKKY